MFTWLQSFTLLLLMHGVRCKCVGEMTASLNIENIRARLRKGVWKNASFTKLVSLVNKY